MLLAVFWAALLSTATLPDRSSPAEVVPQLVFDLRSGRQRRRDRRRARRSGAMTGLWARRLRALQRDVVRTVAVGAIAASVFGPAVAGVFVVLPVLREVLLLIGMATGRGLLLRSALAVDVVLRRAGRVGVAVGLLALFAGDTTGGHLAAGLATAGVPAVTLEVVKGRALLSFHAPVVLELPSETDEDERLAMVLSRLLRTPEGKPVLTHQTIADAFGKNARQDSHNRMQKLARAGGSPAGMILDGERTRRPTIHPRLRERVARYWEREPLASAELTRAWLASQETSSDRADSIGLPSLEQIKTMHYLDGDLVAVRRAVRRQLERGSCGIRPSTLQRQLLEVVDAQDERLRQARTEPVAMPGLVEAARQAVAAPEHRPTRTALALVEHLRSLVATTSPEQDEQLAEALGADQLAPLHFGTLYCLLRLSFGQVAALVGRSKSVVYRAMVSLAHCLDALDPWPASTRFSGVLALDEKWVKIPKSYTKEERHKGKRWRYAHFAVDACTGDLLHVDIFETCDAAAVRAFLVDLRAKGFRPKVVVTDMLGSYANAIRETFGPKVVHHYCLFHHLQAVRQRLREKVGPDWNKQPVLRDLVASIDDIYRCKTRRTARRRLDRVLGMRDELTDRVPEAVALLDTLDKRFPRVVNAIGRDDVPMTNNCVERVIGAFDRHYRNMAALESVESARIQLRLFRFFYRLTPMCETERKELRGLSPLDRAGFRTRGVPLADYVRRFRQAWEQDGPDLLAPQTPRHGEPAPPLHAAAA